MAPNEIDPALVTALFAQLAVFAMVAGGVLMIVGLRRWTGRCWLLALLFLVVATLGPTWLP